MKLPYEKARAGEHALLEVQRILSQFGCQAMGNMMDNERGLLIVQFRWRGREISMEVSWHGYAAAWLRAHPYSARNRVSKSEYERKANQIGKLAVCSVLRDWIKGQITAIECGVLSFDAVFLPHMLMSDGRRVIERARDVVPLPHHDSRKVVELKP